MTNTPNPQPPHGTDFPSAHDPLLFTPGPLTTSLKVKQAMAYDIGAWDAPLKSLIKEIRDGLLTALGTSQAQGWECVLMQGSGSFSVEAAVVSLVPTHGKIAVVTNGAYGQRFIKIAEMAGIEVLPIVFAENQPAEAKVIASMLAENPDVTTVGIIHCETTTGLLNNIQAVGEVVNSAGKTYIVDAMSSFGAYDIDITNIDALISSANKCIEGVPGFGFVFSRKALLQASGEGSWARSHSLDLYDQWIGFEKGGKFRFTPPNQVLLGFQQALREFFAEGGVAGRKARYQDNYQTLIAGMTAQGFVPFLETEKQSHIINTFLCPADDNYDFLTFYNKLSDRGFVIYPGKVTGSECFRIGNIGRLYPRDISSLLNAIEGVTQDMNFDPSHVAISATV